MRISLAASERQERLVIEREGKHHVLKIDSAEFISFIGSGAAVDEGLIGHAITATSLRFPIQPRKIVAIGLNYLDHVREARVERPVRPLVFAKFPSAVVGDGAEILVDRKVAQRVDWEVELGVVIGRGAAKVPVARALKHVFGYVVANDVSARDVQFADGQWIRGKNLDTFCPLGSAIVTADEIPDPQSLALGTEVNGVPVQHSSTAEMIFTVAELISFCSHSFRLDPGDVILTGTPWGCGEFMVPQRSLQDGDAVRVWIEHVGSLGNTVRDLRVDLAK